MEINKNSCEKIFSEREVEVLRTILQKFGYDIEKIYKKELPERVLCFRTIGSKNYKDTKYMQGSIYEKVEVLGEYFSFDVFNKHFIPVEKNETI